MAEVNTTVSPRGKGLGLGTNLMLVVLFLVSCRDSPTEKIAPEGSQDVDCGAVAAWDTDGDGLSDSIERNNADEGYHPFDPAACDEDPTRPQGSWHGGTIDGAVNLTDRGAGYRHYRNSDPVDGDDWGTLELIRCIEAVGRGWQPSGRRLNVGDLSLRPGGPFIPHRSHQNGLDVDLRYARKDGRDHPLDLRYHPEDHDIDATRELLRLFLERCEVLFILVDSERIGFAAEDLGPGHQALRHAPGHSNHFHVRLRQP